VTEASDDSVLVTINGNVEQLTTATTVDALVALWCPSPRGVAVAVDGEVIPRSLWPSTQIVPGAVIEIVTAAAGG
jgi:sulfur carrier protein